MIYPVCRFYLDLSFPPAEGDFLATFGDGKARSLGSVGFLFTMFIPWSALRGVEFCVRILRSTRSCPAFIRSCEMVFLSSLWRSAGLILSFVTVLFNSRCRSLFRTSIGLKSRPVTLRTSLTSGPRKYRVLPSLLSTILFISCES